jgi:hypothetical protein
MKNILSALWKIVTISVVYFIANAVIGILLPLSNDLNAAMSPEDQAAFFPIFVIDLLIRMTVLYLVINYIRFTGWKLFFGVWMAFWGICSAVNLTELFWYNEAFPLVNFLDVTKMMIHTLLVYGITVLVCMLLCQGFRRKEKSTEIRFRSGRFGWRIILFCVLYAPFYYLCGFSTRLYEGVRDFYAAWAMTMEPLYMLLLFNAFRGLLWFVFALPLLTGFTSRKQALLFVPLVLFVGTAVEMIVPQALMPGIVRWAHFIELGFSMILVGLFMVWLMVKEINKETRSSADQNHSIDSR